MTMTIEGDKVVTTTEISLDSYIESKKRELATLQSRQEKIVAELEALVTE